MAKRQVLCWSRDSVLIASSQARITLARAIYSKAGVLLLDDVFAALDVHTAKWIVDKCFSGDLVKSRTIILVVSRRELVGSHSHLTLPLLDAQPCFSPSNRSIHRGTGRWENI